MTEKQQGYKYKASIIIPIYNVEKYLETCFESLEKQTMDSKDMEVLLVVDGSPDHSFEICEKKAKENSMFKAFWKENEGPGATRNYALDRAQGKYIFFLDPDDTLTPQTVKNVTDFFDDHYDETDLVTIPIVRMRDGKELKLHYRFETLKETGIYDLTKIENAFIAQTNINVCVKNESTIRFDTRKGFRHEDQKYAIQQVQRKLTIGYCNEAGYSYLKRPESVTGSHFNPIELFEMTTKFWEDLFAEYPYGEVPLYYQAMYLSDLDWKLRSDILFPYHYEPEAFNEAVNRLLSLLKQVDYRVITGHIGINAFLKCFWLKVQENPNLQLFLSDEGINILTGASTVFASETITIKICKFRVLNGQLHVVAYAKSPVFLFIDSDVKIEVTINGATSMILDTFSSANSYFHSGIKNQQFWAFKMDCPVEGIETLSFSVLIGDARIPGAIRPHYSASFGNEESGATAFRENWKITLHGVDHYSFEKVSPEECGGVITEQLKADAFQYKSKHKVWLYYDLYTVKKDNGYYQFINDIKHDDGIERYYVYNRPIEEIKEQFPEEIRGQLIEYGSERHKSLYLSTQLILTSYYEKSAVSPFESEEEEEYYADIIDFKTVYLQNGVLHADLFRDLNVENCYADKIVVSSPFEQENYCNKYHYDMMDLIPTAMARYDYIDRTKEPKRRILFAPSWRQYLTVSHTPSHWNVVEQQFKESNYYKRLQAFLSDSKLEELLEQEDLYLDYKPHPIMASAEEEIFSIDSNRIRMVGEDVSIEDYALIITDFSSYVFDYACLVRPVIYYIPDYEEFKSGMHHYRKLDLPLEDAFGHFYTETEQVIEEIRAIAERGFVSESQYKERMNNFYLPLENCAERIYQYCMNWLAGNEHVQ